MASKDSSFCVISPTKRIIFDGGGGAGGNSLVVQELRIHFAMQGMWVQSLVGELASHMSQSN